MSLASFDDDSCREDRIVIVGAASCIKLAINDFGVVGPQTLIPPLKGWLLVHVAVKENSSSIWVRRWDFNVKEGR